MAFLAARYLSDMLEEALQDAGTRTVFEEEGSYSVPTVSSQLDSNFSPGTGAVNAGYQQPVDSGAFPQWSVNDLMGSLQPGNKLNECDMLNLETPLDADSALLWNFSL
jgi:hypothetical protein